MYNALSMGRKALTVSVVVATLAWAVGLAALLMPLAAGAATLSAGDLIKASQPAVYYYGADGKRYVFPNEKTYKTWYADFSSVKKITDAELAAVAIGGNVTYKPGAKMVKITTDPKVYAVDAGGALRWVNSEQVAADLYGSTWAKMVEDVPDAFFVNYKMGADIAKTADYDKTAVATAAVSINVDKGLASAGGGGGAGALTLAAAEDNPASASVVVDSDTSVEDSGQQRAALLKVKFTAGAAEVKITGLKVKRGGISKDGDVDNTLLMDGKNVLAEAQSVTSGVATFALSGSPIVVPANSSKSVTLAVNLNKGTANGSTINLSLASADVTSDAASTSGSASGNSMTVVAVSDLGQLEIGQSNSAPASVDPGVLAKEMWRVSFDAAAQDILLTYVKFTNLGSALDSDIQNIKLMDGSTQLNGVVSQVVNKEVVFDMTSMTGGGYKILAGQSKQLSLVGDIVAGTSRTYEWTIQKQYDVHATDMQYNVEAFVDDYDATDDDAFGVVNQDTSNTGDDTTINTGTLSVSVAADSPATYVPASGTGITLAKFNFKASGEDVKVTALTVICSASTTTRALASTKVLLDGVQVGSSDTAALCDLTTDEAVYTFGNSFIVGAGKTGVVSIVADLNAAAGVLSGSTAFAADDTVYVGFGGTATAQGKTSLTSITPSNLNGRTLTLKGGTVTVLKDQSFADRSTNFPTGVSNAANVKIGSFIIVAGAGEDVNVTQIVLRDDSTNQVGDNFQNLVVKDRDGNQVGTTISSLNTTEGSYTITPSASIKIGAGAQKAFDIFADILGSPTNLATNVTGIEVDTVSATGALTGASANWGAAGDTTSGANLDVALQIMHISANGNLTVDEAADTPVSQQLVLGATGVELAKFKLSATAAEDITITQFVVADDMTHGGGSRRSASTGTIKNLKLYNGSALVASVAALDATYNTHAPNAVFTGFSLTIPKNQNVTLTVKADLASYDDGGKASSVHRLVVPNDWKDTTVAADDAITAVGAGSGFSISSGSLDMNGAALTGNNDADVRGNYMDMVRAKLTLAHASDSPSGAATVSSEQTVAKFVATNSANVGNYTATIANMNFAVSASGNSLTAASTMKVYKDSVTSANQLASTDYGKDSQNSAFNYSTNGASTITAANFTDVDVAAGTSRTLVVTLETSDGGFGSADTLSVSINASSNGGQPSIQWTDGNDNGVGSNDNYFTVDTLPLAGKTLVY